MKKFLPCMFAFLLFLSACNTPSNNLPNQTQALEEVEQSQELISDSPVNLNMEEAEKLLEALKSSMAEESWEEVIELNDSIKEIVPDTDITEESAILALQAREKQAEQERLALEAAEKEKAELMSKLQTAYDAADWKKAMSIAADIIWTFPESDEAEAALKLHTEAKESFQEEGKQALDRLTSTYDKVENYTQYYPQSKPKYVNTRSAFYLVIQQVGQRGTGNSVLGCVMVYVGDDWIFFDKVIISIDGIRDCSH